MFLEQTIHCTITKIRFGWKIFPVWDTALKPATVKGDFGRHRYLYFQMKCNLQGSFYSKFCFWKPTSNTESRQKGKRNFYPTDMFIKRGSSYFPPSSTLIKKSLQTLAVIFHLLKVTTEMVPPFYNWSFQELPPLFQKNRKTTRVIKICNNELSCYDFERK